MHECPDCCELCRCKGDIDDINFGEVDWCEHWKICGRAEADYEEDQAATGKEGER